MKKTLKKSVAISAIILSFLIIPFTTHAYWLGFRYAEVTFAELPPASFQNFASTSRPKMDTTMQVTYALRNGENVVNGAEVRFWLVPICAAAEGNGLGGPPLWDFVGSTLLTHVELPQLDPEELVTGTVAFPVTQKNGFHFGDGLDGPGNTCNNLVVEFFSPNNALQLHSGTMANGYLHVDDLADEFPDYQVTFVHVNGENPDHVVPQVPKSGNSSVKFVVENTSPFDGEGQFSVCFSPRNHSPIPLRQGFCEYLDPLAAGQNTVVEFQFDPSVSSFSMDQLHPDATLNIGEINTVAIDINHYEYVSEQEYDNNETVFDIMVQAGI